MGVISEPRHDRGRPDLDRNGDEQKPVDRNETPNLAERFPLFDLRHVLEHLETDNPIKKMVRKASGRSDGGDRVR